MSKMLSPKYHAIPSDESLSPGSEGSDAAEKLSWDGWQRTTRPSGFIQRLPWLIHALLLLISGSMLGISLFRDSHPLPLSADTSTHPQKHPVRFKGAFNIQTPFKGPPSPEVEKEWAFFTHIGPMNVYGEEFAAQNASKYAVHVPSDLGGGHLGMYEWIHQLHCLEELWRHTWPDYYRETFEFSQKNSEWWHQHADHCADILRQKILCDLDDNILTYNWIKGHAAPKPNYNTVHMCRSLDDAYERAVRREIQAENYPAGHFTRPKQKTVVEFDDVPYDPNAEDCSLNLEIGPQDELSRWHLERG